MSSPVPDLFFPAVLVLIAATLLWNCDDSTEASSPTVPPLEVWEHCVTMDTGQQLFCLSEPKYGDIAISSSDCSEHEFTRNGIIAVNNINAQCLNKTIIFKPRYE